MMALHRKLVQKSEQPRMRALVAANRV